MCSNFVGFRFKSPLKYKYGGDFQSHNYLPILWLSSFLVAAAWLNRPAPCLFIHISFQIGQTQVTFSCIIIWQWAPISPCKCGHTITKNKTKKHLAQIWKGGGHCRHTHWICLYYYPISSETWSRRANVVLPGPSFHSSWEVQSWRNYHSLTKNCSEN